MTKPKFSFGLIADCQYADADNEKFIVENTDLESDRHFRDSVQKLREAVSVFNERQVDFVVHLGDLIDRPFSDADAILAVCENTKMPFRNVLGNHDLHDTSIDVASVTKKFGMPNQYYSWVMEDHKFIALNSNQLGVIGKKADTSEWERGQAYLRQLRSEGRDNAYSWNGGIDGEQMEWLRSELLDAERQNQKAILLAHHPVFPPNMHNMLNQENVLLLIDGFDNVAAFFNGHNHFGNFGMRNNIPYLTLHGVVEGDDNAFAIAHVFDDRIEIEGFGREPNRILEVD